MANELSKLNVVKREGNSRGDEVIVIEDETLEIVNDGQNFQEMTDDSDSELLAKSNLQDQKNYGSVDIEQPAINDFQNPQKLRCLSYENSVGLLARWLAHDSIWQKLLLYPFVDKNSSEGRWRKFRKHINYLLYSDGIPQDKKYQIRAALYVTSFLHGAGLITEWLWPVAFTGLLTHDITTYYTQPESRYGNELWQILLGWGDNAEALSSHLGSDLPTEWQYWVWPGLIAGTAALTGLAQVIRRFQWGNKPLEENTANVDSGIFAQTAEDINELSNQMFGLSPVNQSIDRATFALKWDGRLDKDKRNILLPGHDSVAEQSGIIGLRGLHMAAAVMDTFEDSAIPYAAETSTLARSKLRTKRFSVRYPYAQYQLWSLGKKSKLILQPLFWAFTLYLFYTKLRLWELWINKFFGLGEFLHDSIDCERQDKQYVYLQEFADYFCTTCGEWPFMYMADTFTTQDCLNGLMAVPRTSEFILKYLPTLLKHRDFDVIDLSQQAWRTWTDDQWQTFLTKLGIITPQLTTFNLSQATTNPDFVAQGKINDLIQFMRNASLQQLDLSRVSLGSTLTQSLMPALRYQPLTYLSLSENNLDDTAIQTISRNLPPQLAILDMHGNLLSDEGFANITPYLRNSTVKDLDVSANTLTGVSVVTAAQLTDRLTKLDLSNQDLSNGNFTFFWQATTRINSMLTTVKLANSQLGDQGLISGVSYFARTSLTNINLQGASLSDQSVAVFFYGLINTTQIKAIDLSDNSISDAGIHALSSSLAKTPIQTLSLARGGFTDISALLQVLPNSQVINLNLAGNLLGDNIAMIWQSPLQIIDLSGNQLTDASCPNHSLSHLRQIALNDNQVTELTIQALAEQASLLTDMSANNNEIKQIAPLMQLAQARPLASVSVNDNAINDTTLAAKNLLKPIEHIDELGDANLSRDERRWLHKRGKPATAIKQLKLANTDMNDGDARALCRALITTQMPFQATRLLPNEQVNPNRVDLVNCRFDYANNSNLFFKRNTSTSQTALAGGSLLFLMVTGGVALLLLFALLYGVYALTPKHKRAERYGTNPKL